MGNNGLPISLVVLVSAIILGALSFVGAITVVILNAVLTAPAE